jgi:hypothetical protein
MTVGGKRVLEHRWLKERELGRKLERWEEVRHVDGDARNNDLSNLVVVRCRRREELGQGSGEEVSNERVGRLVGDKLILGPGEVSEGFKDISTLKVMQREYRGGNNG